MNILHITDFHYNSERYDAFTQDQIIDKLCLSLETKKDNVDLIVFSGDITFNGASLKEFEEAKLALFDKVCNCLNISEDKLVFCAGNHDFNREFNLPSLENYFNSSILDSDKLYDFAKDRNQDYLNSIKGITNFIEFSKDYYSNQDIVEDLYSVHRREIDKCNIGIVTINSGWRAVDDSAQNRLLFPIYQLEKALSVIEDCECKLFIVHHPLFWFKEL